MWIEVLLICPFERAGLKTLIHRVQRYRAKQRYRADFFNFSGAITLHPVYLLEFNIKRVENIKLEHCLERVFCRRWVNWAW